MKNHVFSRIPERVVPVFLFIALSISLWAAPKTVPQTHPRTLPNFWDPVENSELALSIVTEMTNEEALAQIFMFGWAGADPSKEVIDWVSLRSLGSIKVFGWNTDNNHKVAQSVATLQKLSAQGRFEIPLFVATDQEGGWIRHIKGKTSETPGNLAIGASGLPSDAWYSGYYIAREIAALGINLNFAPTIDLYTDHDSTVIGPRSFGEDPVSVGVLGASFMAGSREAGVLSTAKHFPGHGHTGIDSHGQLPVITISSKTLENRELVPFEYLIKAGVPAIMSAHLSFPSIVGSGCPASFSSYFLNDLLREKLGFTGLIITDDIMMNGATSWAGSVSKAVLLAIEAGNDIVESSTTPFFSDPLWHASISRMEKNEKFRLRVQDAAIRVITAKLSYFKSGNAVPLIPDESLIDTRVPDPNGESFFLSQAARSVTFVRNETIPLRADAAGRVLLVSAFSDFLSAGKKRFNTADVSGTRGNLHTKAKGYDTVIFCLAGKDDIRLLKDLRYSGARIIVISAMSPVLLTEVPWVTDAIAIYSYSPFSFAAAFSALAGDFTPTGDMPLQGIQ